MRREKQIFFASFRFDTTEQRLFRDSDEIALRPKDSAVLQYLLARPNQLATRRELLDAFWSQSDAGEEGLTKCISEIRTALGDNHSNPQIIRTVPRRGYQLIAGVVDDAKPHQLAADQFLSWLDNDRSNLVVRHIHTSEELTQLWGIDKEAYEEASITLGEFLSWWEIYDFGNKVLFHGDTIIGSFGLWPLSDEYARGFKAGTIREGDLLPLGVGDVANTGAHQWYASGIVLRPELRGLVKANPVAQLLTVGLNLWIESNHIAWPVEVIALGYSPEGQNMLERFSFVMIKERCSNDDPYPLYSLRAHSKQDLLALLKKRGL